jgi:hypothetical protein
MCRVAMLLLAVMAGTATAATAEIQVGGGTIDLAYDGDRAAIEDWVRRAAGALTAYYGKFPVAHVRIQVDRVPGDGIHGTTYGGRYIHMRVGRGARFTNDWTLTHEMFHLAFPDLDERHHWMEEGMATYFEPIARARVGDLDPAQVWRDLFEGLPKGLPEAGDRGLDRTPTWGRTYWGGALFWFMCDLAIRERTGNKRSVDDAMRAILAAGGDGTEHWDIQKVLEVGDRATGTTVMAELYARMATAPFPVDLRDLERRVQPLKYSIDQSTP